MINNMDSLYPLIRKEDVILVEGDSQITKMIILLTQSTWSHCALYVGEELLIKKGGQREAVVKQFGNDDADRVIVETFATTGVIASPMRKYQNFNIRVCRPHEILPQDLDSAVSEVISNLGRQYAHRNIIDLGLMLLPPPLNPF